MKILFALCLSLVVAASATTVASAQAASDVLKVGDTAPDFSLMWATRDSVSFTPLKLSALEGNGPVVLAFYPADFSGGCTKEVCSMRDNFAALQSTHAEIVGLSGDYPFSSHEWAKQLNLPFKLASDHKHEVAKAYASYDERSGFNSRTVYAIDKAGKIGYIDMHYSPRDSVSLGKLQAALKQMN
jgi:peroxiredoxin